MSLFKQLYESKNPENIFDVAQSAAKSIGLRSSKENDYIEIFSFGKDSYSLKINKELFDDKEENEGKKFDIKKHSTLGFFFLIKVYPDNTLNAEYTSGYDDIRTDLDGPKKYTFAEFKRAIRSKKLSNQHNEGINYAMIKKFLEAVEKLSENSEAVILPKWAKTIEKDLGVKFKELSKNGKLYFELNNPTDSKKVETYFMQNGIEWDATKKAFVKGRTINVKIYNGMKLTNGTEITKGRTYLFN